MPRDKIMSKRKETNTLYFVMNTHTGKNTVYKEYFGHS